MAENLNYNASDSKCYNNLESNCNTYGRLYNWETAQTACPSGWHLPSEPEWTTLTDFVGGKLSNYGFSALLAGHGYYDGRFTNINSLGYWWSTLEASATGAWYWYIRSNENSINGIANAKSLLFSVRCLQN